MTDRFQRIKASLEAKGFRVGAAWYYPEGEYTYGIPTVDVDRLDTPGAPAAWCPYEAGNERDKILALIASARVAMERFSDTL